MTKLEHHEIDSVPGRILGMQRLEALFNQIGYLICQSTGTRIYDFDKIVAFYIPLNSSTDQIMIVHSDHATDFLKTCLLNLSW